MTWVIAAMVGAFITSVALTGLIRRYAIVSGLLDSPNARSAHAVAIPRGGGLGFTGVLLLGTALLFWLFPEKWGLWIGLIGGIGAVGAVGWWDDRHNLSALQRLIVHIGAAAWTLCWIDGVTTLDLGSITLSLSWLGSLFAMLFLVWFINLYNFMDGIDGLAAGQAVLAGVVSGAMLLGADEGPMAALLGLMAASGAGFLVWNWPPAKIYMGDVGSGVLGYVFGVCILYTAKPGSSDLHFVAWLLIFGWFLVDTTLTLSVRIGSGKRWYEAHSSHAYQVATRHFGNHKHVTVYLLVLGVALSILSVLTVMVPTASLPLLVLGTFLVTGIWCRWRSFEAREQSA